MTESAESKHPRDMPTTMGRTVGLIIFGLISSVLAVPFVTSPVTIWLILTDGIDPTSLQIYVGIIISLAIPGVSNMEIGKNEAGDDRSISEKIEESMRIFQENIRILIIVLGLMVLYINLLFLGTLWATTAAPAWAWYTALVVPFADRALISSVGYSPTFTPVMAMAYILQSIQVADDINLNAVRQFNITSLTQPQTPAA
jgi:hypothetical protein